MSLTNFPFGVTSFGKVVPGGASIGNEYYACQSTDTANYAYWYGKFGTEKYDDGSTILHTTIQSAINACVANRGDVVYVIGEWTSTSTITLNKWGTSLIGLTDWNNITGGGNSNITCTGAGIATLSVTKAKCHVENLVVYFNGTGDTFGINFTGSAPSQTIVRNVECVKNGGSSAAGIGIHFATVPTRSCFEDIKITGTTKNTLSMAYGIEGGSYSCVFKNIQVSGATVGINLDTYGDVFDHIIITSTCVTGLVLTGTHAAQSIIVDSYDGGASVGSISATVSGSYSTGLTVLA